MSAYAAELFGYLASAFMLVILATFYVSWRATRLDRLHARVETAKAALDAALVRRSAVVADLAAAGLLDPATSLLLGGAAREARACDGEPRASGREARASGAIDDEPVYGDRELAESDLSRAVRAAVDQPDFRGAVAAHPGGSEVLSDLDAAAVKVMLARRFYNDAVRDTRAARRQRLTRAFRLAGHAPAPAFFEIDDVPPAFPEEEEPPALPEEDTFPAVRGEEDTSPERPGEDA